MDAVHYPPWAGSCTVTVTAAAASGVEAMHCLNKTHRPVDGSRHWHGALNHHRDRHILVGWWRGSLLCAQTKVAAAAHTQRTSRRAHSCACFLALTTPATDPTAAPVTELPLRMLLKIDSNNTSEEQPSLLHSCTHWRLDWLGHSLSLRGVALAGRSACSLATKSYYLAATA
jgi:hypothetical protein